MKGGEGNGGFGMGDDRAERDYGGFSTFNLQFSITNGGFVSEEIVAKTPKWKHCGRLLQGLGDCKLL